MVTQPEEKEERKPLVSATAHEVETASFCEALQSVPRQGEFPKPQALLQRFEQLLMSPLRDSAHVALLNRIKTN